MPSNDFKPFATGSSANVTDQTSYAAASTTTNGFSSGLAKSADVNKVLRQASFGVAALAQMMVDTTGANVADDGTLANFETTLQAAIGQRKAIFTANGSFIVPAGVTKIYVSACGGGGGGAGAAGNNGISGNAGGGGGGGAGQSVLRAPYTVTPGQTIAITIGGGGSAGAGGVSNFGGNSGSGGSTVIGSLVTLAGGSGGSGGSLGTGGAGGPGGSGYPNGSAGDDGPAGGAGGAGGSCPFGGGGPRVRGAQGGANNGVGGYGAGGGGGGGSACYNAATVSGGNGSPGSAGIAIIEF